MDDQVVHDGRCAIVVGAVFAHRVEHGLRFDPAQADVRAAQHRHRPGETPAVAVEHRQGPQVFRKVRHRPGGRVAHRVQVGAAVVGDDSLGVAGGAAGVADGDGVPLVGRALQWGQRFVRGQQCLVLVFADALTGAFVFAVADVDHHRRAPVFAAQQLQRLRHHRRELAVGDQHLGLAVVHLPGQQRRVQPRVQRIEHGVQCRHGVVRLHHLGRVGQHHADRAAAHHAQCRQRGGQARAAVTGLLPGVAALAVDHCRQVGEHLGAAFDKAHRRQRSVVRRVLGQVLFVDVVGHGDSAFAVLVAPLRCFSLPLPAPAPGRCPTGCRRCAPAPPRCAPCRAARRRPAAARRRAVGAWCWPGG